MAKHKFTLKKKEIRAVKAGRGTKDEEVYFYESAAGEKLAFHAHPTQAFVWVFVQEGCANVTQKLANKILDAFVKAMMDRGEKTPDQAIADLEV